MIICPPLHCAIETPKLSQMAKAWVLGMSTENGNQVKFENQQTPSLVPFWSHHTTTSYPLQHSSFEQEISIDWNNLLRFYSGLANGHIPSCQYWPSWCLWQSWECRLVGNCLEEVYYSLMFISTKPLCRQGDWGKSCAGNKSLMWGTNK